MRLLDRVALVTGGSQGIGEATCMALAREGADVVVNFRSHRPAAEAVGRKVEKAGRKALIYQADVSRIDPVQAMIERTLEKFGKIDILVNNAGIVSRKDIGEISDEEWDLSLNVNLKGVFNCCQKVSPFMMKRRSGKIINISSAAAFGVAEVGVHYSASKSGIIGLSRMLAVQLAPFQITVNTICPGSVATERSLRQRTKEQVETVIKRIPLGRLGKPEEVAAAVVFLASDDANFITGATLHINGGAYLA